MSQIGTKMMKMTLSVKSWPSVTSLSYKYLNFLSLQMISGNLMI